MKTWTYEEITKSAEDFISRCIEPSAAGPRVDQIRRCMAKGAFLSWNDLTREQQTVADASRLQAMANRPASQLNEQRS